MARKIDSKSKPRLVVGVTDHHRLSALAAQAAHRLPEVADELMGELERARVASDRSVADNVVRMGSLVTFKPDTGEEKTVTLVFPGQADIAQGKVSILTPIGVALLGLSTGQTMTWTARDGCRHQLEVMRVVKDGAEGIHGRPKPAAASKAASATPA